MLLGVEKSGDFSKGPHRGTGDNNQFRDRN
jgi:hypothetical protein